MVSRTASVFPDFEKGGSNDAQAIVFSPDGSTLYVTTGDNKVAATSSGGGSSPAWWATASDSDLCDITISPDGLSVRFDGQDSTVAANRDKFRSSGSPLAGRVCSSTLENHIYLLRPLLTPGKTQPKLS